ncbi:MAG: hydroxymethylbilane synthase [Hyphomonadaceae bacterium]
MSNTSILFRIGARGSPLSRAQVARIRMRLARAKGIEEERIEFVPITTSGDRIQDRALIEAGGKGLFTKELDEALLDGRIDLAVHSMKDLPSELPPGIVIAGVPEREDPRDAFISLRVRTLADLPHGARLGSASVRRQAQALRARPDLQCGVLRGNVETRLKKLKSGEFDATFLALAGLKRLGLEAHAQSLVDPNDMPPAACQGALAITTREADVENFQALDDVSATIETACERAFLGALDGSCRTPIAALARKGDSATLSFIGETLTLDGKQRWRREETLTFGMDPVAEAHNLGIRLAQSIIEEAGEALVRA